MMKSYAVTLALIAAAAAETSFYVVKGPYFKGPGAPSLDGTKITEVNGTVLVAFVEDKRLNNTIRIDYNLGAVEVDVPVSSTTTAATTTTDDVVLKKRSLSDTLLALAPGAAVPGCGQVDIDAAQDFAVNQDPNVALGSSVILGPSVGGSPINPNNFQFAIIGNPEPNPVVSCANPTFVGTVPDFATAAEVAAIVDRIIAETGFNVSRMLGNGTGAVVQNSYNKNNVSETNNNSGQIGSNNGNNRNNININYAVGNAGGVNQAVVNADVKADGNGTANFIGAVQCNGKDAVVTTCAGKSQVVCDGVGWRAVECKDVEVPKSGVLASQTVVVNNNLAQVPELTAVKAVAADNNVAPVAVAPVPASNVQVKAANGASRQGFVVLTSAFALALALF